MGGQDDLDRKLEQQPEARAQPAGVVHVRRRVDSQTAVACSREYLARDERPVLRQSRAPPGPPSPAGSRTPRSPPAGRARRSADRAVCRPAGCAHSAAAVPRAHRVGARACHARRQHHHDRAARRARRRGRGRARSAPRPRAARAGRRARLRPGPRSTPTRPPAPSRCSRRPVRMKTAPAPEPGSDLLHAHAR